MVSGGAWPRVLAAPDGQSWIGSGVAPQAYKSPGVCRCSHILPQVLLPGTLAVTAPYAVKTGAGCQSSVLNRQSFRTGNLCPTSDGDVCVEPLSSTPVDCDRGRAETRVAVASSRSLLNHYPRREVTCRPASVDGADAGHRRSRLSATLLSNGEQQKLMSLELAWLSARPLTRASTKSLPCVPAEPKPFSVTSGNTSAGDSGDRRSTGG
jgi:hypothetical protein